MEDRIMKSGLLNWIKRNSSTLLLRFCRNLEWRSLCIPAVAAHSLGAAILPIDFEESRQDFVLETKQLVFPQFPDAFNPSIIRWNGSLLLSFRFYHPETRQTNQIGLVYLDEELNPVGKPQVLEIMGENPFFSQRRQDPRLIQIQNRLFMVYNVLIREEAKVEIRRMMIAEIFFDQGRFFARNIDCLTQFADENPHATEKNWVPFQYNGQLLLARLLIPHLILHPTFENGSCESMFSTTASVNWSWGQPRGGTPALLVDNEYLAFFHSSANLRTVHSNGKLMQHYFMGAYTFSSEAPFFITRMSPEPIAGSDFYHGPEYQTWKPLRVVFPAGFVFDNQFIWVTYGRQDHEIWIVKLDKKKLLDSLVPVAVR